MTASDNLSPKQLPYCPDCGAHTAPHPEHNGEVLLHRGVAEYGITGLAFGPRGEVQHPRYSSAEEMFKNEGPGGDLDREYGRWWGGEQLARFYGGEEQADNGMRVSAWFPKSAVRSSIPGHEGHIVQGQGRIHEIHVRDEGEWRKLPHKPGMTIATDLDREAGS